MGSDAGRIRGPKPRDGARGVHAAAAGGWLAVPPGRWAGLILGLVGAETGRCVGGFGELSSARSQTPEASRCAAAVRARVPRARGLQSRSPFGGSSASITLRGGALHAARRRRRLNPRSSQATAAGGWIGGRGRRGRCGRAGDAADQRPATSVAAAFFARARVPGASNVRKQARVEQRTHVLFRRPSLAAWRARAVAMMLARIMLSRQPKLRERLGRRSQEPRKGPAPNGVAVLLGAAPVRENCALAFYITPAGAQPSHAP